MAVTPYIIPAMLTNLAPFGIDWASIPVSGVGAAANVAALWDLCLLASDSVDTTVNMPLRATLDVETLMGPDQRVSISGSTGVAVALMGHWPILTVAGAQWTTTGGFPQVFNTIPSNMMAVGEPSTSFAISGGTAIPGGAGDGMNAIIIAPGYIDWTAGRQGFTVQIAYINGWPHAGLDVTAAANATSIHVDDVTGFAGTRPMLWDAGSTERVNVTSVTADSPLTVFGNTVQSGPGTLNLSSGLSYAHTYAGPGPSTCVVTAVPSAVRNAGYYFSAAEAMQRGSTQISMPVLPGSVMTAGQPSIASFIKQAELMLKPYGRVF